MSEVIDVSVNRIYSHSSVVGIEIAGFKIISTLLDSFINALMFKSEYGKKLLKLFPEQYLADNVDDYSRIQSV